MSINKRAIFINTASQVVARVLTLALSLVSIKLLANYLGVYGVGQYNTINTYAGIVIVIADLGLFSVAVREIIKHPEREKTILGNTLAVRMISALVAAGVSALLVYFTGYEQAIKSGVLIASFYILFNLIGSVYDVLLQARLKMQYSALAELISRAISLAALALVIYYRGNFYLIIGTIGVYGLATYLLKYYFARRILKFGIEYDKVLALKIINMAWPLGLVFIVNNIFFKLDTLMLFAIKGAGAVGIYSVAYRVLEVTLFVGGFFANSLLPDISKNISRDKEQVGNIVSKAIPIMIYLALPVTLLCVVLPGEIIQFLSNADFVAGANTLRVLAFVLPLIYCDILLGAVLIANDERKYMIKVAVAILLINFTANLYMISRFSYMGAAVTTLVSEVLLLAINYLYVRRVIRSRLDFGRVGKIALIALGAFAAGMGVKQWLPGLWAGSVAVIGVYIGLSWATNVINLGQMKTLLRTEK